MIIIKSAAKNPAFHQLAKKRPAERNKKAGEQRKKSGKPALDPCKNTKQPFDFRQHENRGENSSSQMRRMPPERQKRIVTRTQP